MANLTVNDGVTRSLLRPTLGCIAVAGLVGLTTLVSIDQCTSVFRSFETCSAVWLTHDMLVTYVSQTDGDWPSDWSDLEPHFTAINQGYGLPGMAWVRERVDITFDIHVAMFDSSNAVQDKMVWVIRMADGTENGEIRNANERIRTLMVNQHSQQSKQ